ncbi:MAG: SWIM zinc finger family protein [Lewinellaceae bacterium]|nr:SWIM zinc finger family protein [Lewinellaceae bacterium]
MEEITRKRPGVWSATVEGGASYSVDIRLAGRDVTATTCNCPYDGAVCKHIVAVLYALREETPKRRGGRRKAPKLHFEDMLQKVNLEELRDFVRHQHETNRDFGDVFKMYFADKDSAINVTDQYRTIIRKIIRNHSNRGFMDYRQSFGFSKEIQPIMQTAYAAVSRKNYRDAAIVGRALLIEVMPIIEACDDSAGNIGDIIAQGIQLLQEVAEADTVSPELQSQLFDFVESSLSDKTWFDYGDFGYEMLAVAECIALKLDQERYLRLLDNLLKIHVGKYSDYLQEHLKKLKIRFLFAIGRTADAEKLTAANMDIVEVRRSAVQQAIDVRDFSKAKQLVWEGIRIAEGKQHPGTVQQWEEKLFDIAKLQGDTGTARQFAKKFAFDRGLNPKYYQEWKMTYPPSEWQTVLESHIQSVVAEEQKRPRKGSWDREDHSLFQRLSPVFIIEEQWQRLLGLILLTPV